MHSFSWSDEDFHLRHTDTHRNDFIVSVNISEQLLKITEEKNPTQAKLKKKKKKG